VAPETRKQRLTGFRWVLLGLQNQYVLAEGFAHRGKQFAFVLAALTEVSRKDSPVFEAELLEVLGPPDYGAWNSLGAEYLYLYTSAAPNDSVAFVFINAAGKLDKVAWGSVASVQLDKYKAYRPWPDKTSGPQ
jgi:hypothetical protein